MSDIIDDDKWVAVVHTTSGHHTLNDLSYKQASRLRDKCKAGGEPFGFSYESQWHVGEYTFFPETVTCVDIWSSK